jgi:hypothetical protein
MERRGDFVNTFSIIVVSDGGDEHAGSRKDSAFERAGEISGG